MPTHGNWARIFTNGWEITPDATQLTITHAYADQKVLPQNVGVEGHAPGLYAPALTFGGYKRMAQGAITAHQLFATNADPDFIHTIALGNGKPPQAGDPAWLFTGSLSSFKGTRAVGEIQTLNAEFRARGALGGLGAILLDSLAKGTVTGAAYDQGAAGATLTTGLIAHAQISQPTGTPASNSITVTAIPADGNALTLVIGGVSYPYTFRTTPTASGQIKIGATASACAINLFRALVGGSNDAGEYIAGTVALPTAVVTLSTPNASNVLTLTAVDSGIGANAWTATRTGTAITLGGATFAGGIDGDTATITVQSAASAGGPWTTCATFSTNGRTRLAERQIVSAGTVIGRYLRAVATLSGATDTLGLNVAVARG